jgi:hypothetical protein
MAILHLLLVIAAGLYITATGYELIAKYDASNFFDESSFRFYVGNDVFTHGLALYVPKHEAIELGLAKNKDNKVHLGVDTTSKLDSATPGEGNGRKSVRLEGVRTFDNGLIIADFDHLPAQACGQWPAL